MFAGGIPATHCNCHLTPRRQWRLEGQNMERKKAASVECEVRRRDRAARGSWMRSLLFGTILTALAAAAGSGVRVQDKVVHVQSKVACRTCSIVLAAEARIGDLDDPYNIDALTSAVAVGDSVVLFAPLFEGGRVGVFSLWPKTSRYIGRPGRGPGDFGDITDLAVGKDDTVFAFEPGRFSAIRTLGQYLRPSSHHAPVARWVTNEEFAEWKRFGEQELGFSHVESGPLVRSSYHAERQARTVQAGGVGEIRDILEADVLAPAEVMGATGSSNGLVQIGARTSN